MKTLIPGYFIGLIMTLFIVQNALCQQGEVETFGKNRVQYNRDFERWDRYESENFITHWYGKARLVAEAVVQYAEYENEHIRSLLEHRTNEKADIIVYTDISDLHQTNLGDNEIFITRPGDVNVLGNKLFVYFDGNQEHLRTQIREGITKIYLAQMLFKDNWQQFFQNLGGEEYPEWYLKGLVAYAGTQWDLKSDNLLRDIVKYKPYKDFYALAEEYPTLAGHLFWLYLTEIYGEGVIANILYLNRINRRVDAAFYYNLNADMEDIIEQAWDYFHRAYEQDLNSMVMPDDENLLRFKNKYCSAITKLKYSKDGNKLALVTNELGKWKLRLFDLESGKEKVLMKGNYRNPFQVPDYNYPLIEWMEDRDELLVIYEKRDEILISQLDTDGNVGNHGIIGPTFQRVYDFDIVGSDTLIFSANIRGADDLYLYLLRTRQMRRVTEDYFDELGVTKGFWQGEEGYFFSSNRLNNSTARQRRDTTLVERNFDLYFLAANKLEVDSAHATRITDTDYNHLKPQYANGKIFFLAEKKGRRFLAAINQDGKTEYISAWQSNIDNFHINGDKYALSLLDNGKEQAYYDIEVKNTHQPVSNSFFYKLIHPTQSEDEKEEVVPEEQLEPLHKLIFQSEFSDPENIPSFRNINIGSQQSGISGPVSRIDFKRDGNVVEFHSPRVVASRLFFKTDGLDFDLDNSPLFSGLNSYAGEKVGYDYPPFGLLVKGRVYDTFEDYIIEGGARYPLSLDGSEYFLVFKDKKHRWDKIYGLYRKSEKHLPDQQQGTLLSRQKRAVSYIGTYEMRYPFNMFKSLRLRATFRQDQVTTLASERNTLEVPSGKEQRLGLRAEYVFDNTYDMAYNMKNGTRYKIYAEVLNRFAIQFAPWNLELNKGLMTTLGFDARHYFRLDKHAILALRGVGATSFGSEQILFTMGGVENWLFPQYSDLSQPGEGNFVYYGLAANMRGFKQNIRNGSSYLLGNIELRVAPINYLSRRQIRSGFLKNLQVVGFVDVGTAWYGFSPYSSANPLNQITVSNPTSEIQARYYRDPIVAGFGGGVRVMLLGMYFRGDYAWGYDTKTINEPSFYFSIGKDF